MDSTEKAFRDGIQNWLQKYNMPKINLDFSQDFAFDFKSDTLYIGVEAFEDVDEYFNEYLEKHGFEWENVPAPVLAFLHELGHANTIHDFNDSQIVFFDFCKQLANQQDDEKEAMFAYWDVPDEYAANRWLIDFSEENIDAMMELVQVYSEKWNDMVKTIDVSSIAISLQEVYERS